MDKKTGILTVLLLLAIALIGYLVYERSRQGAPNDYEVALEQSNNALQEESERRARSEEAQRREAERLARHAEEARRLEAERVRKLEAELAEKQAEIDRRIAEEVQARQEAEAAAEALARRIQELQGQPEGAGLDEALLAQLQREREAALLRAERAEQRRAWLVRSSRSGDTLTIPSYNYKRRLQQLIQDRLGVQSSRPVPEE